jgi:arylsulfatase A-like enzyme
MDAHVPLRPLRVHDDQHSAPNAWSSPELDFWRINLDGPSVTSETNLTHYRNLYIAAIDYFDRRIAAFVKTLSRRSDRETMFLIIADHGKNLAFESDRNLIDHKCSLTERLLHVPFLVVNPSGDWEYNGEYLSPPASGPDYGLCSRSFPFDTGRRHVPDSRTARNQN